MWGKGCSNNDGLDLRCVNQVVKPTCCLDLVSGISLSLWWALKSTFLKQWKECWRHIASFSSSVKETSAAKLEYREGGSFFIESREGKCRFTDGMGDLSWQAVKDFFFKLKRKLIRIFSQFGIVGQQEENPDLQVALIFWIWASAQLHWAFAGFFLTVTFQCGNDRAGIACMDLKGETCDVQKVYN